MNSCKYCSIVVASKLPFDNFICMLFTREYCLFHTALEKHIFIFWSINEKTFWSETREKGK